jgi:hypothetical protein
VIIPARRRDLTVDDIRHVAAEMELTARPMGAGRWALCDGREVVIVLCEANVRRNEPDPTTN